MDTLISTHNLNLSFFFVKLLMEQSHYFRQLRIIHKLTALLEYIDLAFIANRL